MKMSWMKLVPIAVAGLMLNGCASVSTGNPSASGESEPVVINDRQIIGQMTSKAAELMDSDSLVEMKTLIEKLKKEPKINLKLPKSNPPFRILPNKKSKFNNSMKKCKPKPNTQTTSCLGHLRC